MSPSSSPEATPRRRSAPVSLNHKLDRQLLGYAVTASAAGVGMMALAQPGLAQIVYTPTHQVIAKNATFDIDFNNDGVTDLTLYHHFSVCRPSQGHNSCSGFKVTAQTLFAYGNAPNGVVAGTFFASALPAGTRVGAGDQFKGDVTMENCHTAGGSIFVTSGPWLNVRNLYLGVTFAIDGETHYGWVRLSVTTNLNTCVGEQVLVTGYAYQTEANKPIGTGQTSGSDTVGAVEQTQPTLGALALGSIGIEAWRRGEKVN
jgi:hypothetical protein